MNAMEMERHLQKPVKSSMGLVDSGVHVVYFIQGARLQMTVTLP